MYFNVNGKQVFATTGGKPFDNSKPVVLFLSGSALDHTFWGLQSRFFAFRKYSVMTSLKSWVPTTSPLSGIHKDALQHSNSFHDTRKGFVQFLSLAAAWPRQSILALSRRLKMIRSRR